MEINHENKLLKNAVGLTEGELDKLSKYCEDILDFIDDKEDIKTSHIYEKVLKQLSYRDLVFLATQYILTEHKRRSISKIDMADLFKEIDAMIKKHKDE